ncbi:MAG TPA: sulfatase-like hydrolase/transferase [Thermoanaerobaculia bacterium]|nr:sulfatase-like hydrolase/transferase [Thermoanaerobaculia bacterium]
MPITDLFANGNLPNIVLIITDQERTLQHWPASFLSKLPAMQQLMNTGLTFHQAFTAASMCCPSRATFLTSNYPAVTGVTTTGSPEPPASLPPPAVFANLAGVLTQAGYATCAWRGKWHLGGGGPDDYGFSGWDPPDAGNYLRINDTLGGGNPDNDQRYLSDILSFLGSSSNTSRPFCLVASFVNPHDVYVGQFGPGQSGYTKADFSKVTVPLPPNVHEDLSTKPRAQAGMSWKNVRHSNTQQEYVNFYAYLQTVVDGQILQVLDALGDLLENTLVIRFADHGEMGLSHGLVEKFYNAYEETIHVPLIFSNPVAWPAAQTSGSLVSLLDLVPTLASLLGVTGDFSGFRGQDLTPVLLDPAAAVQDAVHFTYDDIPTGLGPSIIRSIRTADYAYSVYFVEDGSDGDWELYDLGADPLQNDNLAGTEAYGPVQEQLDQQLQCLMAANGTAPSFTWPPQQTADSRGGPPAVGAHAVSAALAEEVATLAAAGSGSVDRLSAILYAAQTPTHIVVRAARALASLDTADAFTAMQPALYGPWPRAVLAKVHDAYGWRARDASAPAS